MNMIKTIHFYYINLLIIIKVLHLGGKIMHHFKALRTQTWFAISFILCFALVIFGCTTSKLVSSKSHQSVNVGLKAEAVSEGICVTFDDIPKEIGRMFISFNNFCGKEEPDSIHDIIESYSVIRGDVLEQVKQTRKIIFPFVKAGQKYTIFVFLGDKQGQEIVGLPDVISTECIANAGIYFNDGLKLELNKTNTSVTLSSETNISKEVKYVPDKYGYVVKLYSSGNECLSYDEKGTNGLYWDFEPNLTNDLKESGYLQSGSYSAFVTAFRNVDYDNVTWSLEVAKTPEFIYSLKL